MEETKQYFLKLSENIMSRTMHDIISPLTAIMNGTSILKLRDEKDKPIIKNTLSNSTIIGFIDSGVQQILNQINLTKYLYTIGREKFLLSSDEFFENLNRISQKYNAKISYNQRLISIWSHEAQLISHIVFVLIDNLNQESTISISKFEEEIHITQQEKPEIILKSILEPDTEITPLNINIHFFRFLLSDLKYEIKSESKKIVIRKI